MLIDSDGNSIISESHEQKTTPGFYIFIILFYDFFGTFPKHFFWGGGGY